MKAKLIKAALAFVLLSGGELVGIAFADTTLKPSDDNISPSCAGPGQVTISPHALRKIALKAADMHQESLEDLREVEKQANGDFVEISNVLTQRLVRLGLIKHDEARQLMQIYNITNADQISISQRANQVASIYTRLAHDASTCPLGNL